MYHSLYSTTPFPTCPYFLQVTLRENLGQTATKNTKLGQFEYNVWLIVANLTNEFN